MDKYSSRGPWHTDHTLSGELRVLKKDIDCLNPFLAALPANADTVLVRHPIEFRDTPTLNNKPLYSANFPPAP